MDVQIMHANIDALRFWINHIHRISHGKSKILFCTMLDHQHMTKSRFLLDKHKQVAVAAAISSVFIILANGMPRFEIQVVCNVSQ